MNKKTTQERKQIKKELDKKVGARLAAFREAKDMTQIELGARVGRAPATIRDYEAGRSHIPDPVKIALSNELQFSIDELLKGDESNIEFFIEKGIKNLSVNRILLYLRLLTVELTNRQMKP